MQEKRKILKPLGIVSLILDRKKSLIRQENALLCLAY